MNSKHISNYRKLGYKCSVNEIIDVKIDDIPKKSKVKVEVMCEVCNKIKKITYCNYLINKNNGGYYSCSNKCSIDKYKNTCLEKYGVENTFQLEETKEKIKETNLKKYGVEHNSHNYDTLEKRKETNKKRYGHFWYTNTEEFRKKTEETWLKNYGVDNPFKDKDIIKKVKKKLSSNEVREKTKNTNLKRYGVEYPTQNKDIFNKAKLNGYYVSKYLDTSLYYQGSYELDFLEKYYDKVKIENGPTITYKLNENKHYYHSDFYLPDYNLIVEIKSNYTYNLHKNKNIAKKKFCIEDGYSFIFVIDKDYSELDIYF